MRLQSPDSAHTADLFVGKGDAALYLQIHDDINKVKGVQKQVFLQPCVLRDAYPFCLDIAQQYLSDRLEHLRNVLSDVWSGPSHHRLRETRLISFLFLSVQGLVDAGDVLSSDPAQL